MSERISSMSDTRTVDAAEIPEFLTARQLEALLRIDVKTIYSYVQRGLIPYVRIQSNLRFPKDEVRAWIARQSYSPHSLNNTRHR